MHIPRRLTIVLVLLTGLVPLGTVTMLGTVNRGELEERLQEALEKAKTQYRSRTGLSALRSASDRTAEKTEEKLSALAREKREVRRKLDELLRLFAATKNGADLAVMGEERAQKLLFEERMRFLRFVRILHARRSTADAQGGSMGDVLRVLLRRSVGDEADRILRNRALARARQSLIGLLLQARTSEALAGDRLRSAAGEIADVFSELQQEHLRLQQEYLETQAVLERAEQTTTLSEEQLGEIKQTVTQVHDDVLRMQAELARIDARIRARAERALIEKGLKAPQPGRHSSGEIAGKAQFSWPAYGRISAGFLNAAYRKFFGVPHHGADIVVAQGTSVAAAADGVVFLVRDGGTTGYTYVLVGHRDGYATLYGHLSAVAVAAGQDVNRGQVIGLSGGAPGTHGAGLMTTAAHLHFEVIQNGVNVDPISVLP